LRHDPIPLATSARWS